MNCAALVAVVLHFAPGAADYAAARGAHSKMGLRSPVLRPGSGTAAVGTAAAGRLVVAAGSSCAAPGVRFDAQGADSGTAAGVGPGVGFGSAGTGVEAVGTAEAVAGCCNAGVAAVAGARGVVHGTAAVALGVERGTAAVVADAGTVAAGRPDREPRGVGGSPVEQGAALPVAALGGGQAEAPDAEQAGKLFSISKIDHLCVL